MAGLKSLAIVSNLSESVKIDGTRCAIRVTTSASSTITVERSIDNSNFSAIPDISLTVNGSDEINLIDIVPGQFLRVRSTAAMSDCKILS
jgi:ribose 5-phosphate isomerase